MEEIILKAYCAIERKGKILLLKDKGVNGWKLPGGFVEKNEFIEEGAVREVEEETGYKVLLTGIVNISEYYLKGIRNIRFLYKAEIISGKMTLQKEEIGKGKWLDRTVVSSFSEQDYFNKAHSIAVTNYLKGSVHSIELFKPVTANSTNGKYERKTGAF